MNNFLQNIPYELIDSIVNILQFLAITIPSLLVFIYFKCHSMNIFKVNDSPNGMTFLLHNRTNKSVYIRSINLINKKNKCITDDIFVIDYKSKNILMPDEFLNIDIHIKAENIIKTDYKIVIIFNNDKCKKFKVKK